MSTVSASGNGHKRAILYARVSTDEQAEYGYSLQTQLEACRLYATEHGYALLEEIADDCSGTIIMGNRPGGKLVLAMIAKRQADALIAHQIDRLSRDWVDFLVIRREWQRAGIELHFVATGQSLNTPEGDILEGLQGWMADNERKRYRSEQ